MLYSAMSTNLYELASLYCAKLAREAKVSELSGSELRRVGMWGIATTGDDFMSSFRASVGMYELHHSCMDAASFQILFVELMWLLFGSSVGMGILEESFSCLESVLCATNYGVMAEWKLCVCEQCGSSDACVSLWSTTCCGSRLCVHQVLGRITGSTEVALRSQETVLRVRYLCAKASRGELAKVIIVKILGIYSVTFELGCSTCCYGNLRQSDIEMLCESMKPRVPVEHVAPQSIMFL